MTLPLTLTLTLTLSPNQVMKFVGNAILPRFAGLLESDYQRWCNGTQP